MLHPRVVCMADLVPQISTSSPTDDQRQDSHSRPPTPSFQRNLKPPLGLQCKTASIKRNSVIVPLHIMVSIPVATDLFEVGIVC